MITKIDLLVDQADTSWFVMKITSGVLIAPPPDRKVSS